MNKITSPIAVLIVGLTALIAFVLITNQTESPDLVNIQTNQSAKINQTNIESKVPAKSVSTVVAEIEEENKMKAIFTTNKGVIELELFDALAPKTVENFVTLAESNFYTNTKFHRVIEGFMIQGGDPLTKDEDMSDRWGTGGPGYTFEDEIHKENNNVIGTISMANAGPNTNGSQFFINTADNDFLDTKHTVFGNVTSGMDVVTAIENVEKFPNDRPIESIIIQSIAIER